MNIPNLSDLLVQGNAVLLFKIPILILIALYALFLFIVIQRIRALNRAVRIISANASQVLMIFVIIQFFLALSLFFLTIVIV